MMTADARYQANIAFLDATLSASGRPTMGAQLAQAPLTNVQLYTSTSGHVVGNVFDVATQTWVPLCHPDDPVQGAESDAAALYTPDAKILTLVGLGLGYMVAALVPRLRPYQRLVVWELDPVLYKAMLYCVDVQPFFTGGKRIDLMIGPDIGNQVEHWWLSQEAVDKLYLGLPMRSGYTATYQPAAYTALVDKTVDMMRFAHVGLSTWKVYGRCIGDNDLANLPEYVQTPGYEHLHDLWAGRPAVCVAAGPSLQKNLRLLCDPAVRSRVAVVAAGTVYAALRAVGIEPDIVTTIDFQRLNWTDQFRYVPLDPDCPLVYLHSTYPQTVRRWPGPKFVAENASDTVLWLRKYTEGKKSAAQVQTVAHLNLLVALELGADPIMLLGQDLSMPPAQHHAVGARAQDDAPNDVAQPEAFVMMPDYAGQPVHTRHSFLSMRTVFSRIAAEYPQRTIRNCSEAGLALDGIPHVPLAAMLPRILAQPPAAPGALRTQVAQVWRTYVPKINDALLTDLQQVAAQVQTLRRFSKTVQAFVREHGLGTDGVRAWVLAQEQLLKDAPIAWGLFAIRHFGIIELLSAIPPEVVFTGDQAIKDRLNSERLLAVARLLEAEAPAVARLVSQTLRRLTDIVTPVDAAAVPSYAIEAAHLRRLAVRQHYGEIHRLIQAGLAWGEPIVYAHYLRHTQQYDAALAVARLIPSMHRQVERMTAHMRRARSEVSAVIPAYFGDEAHGRPVRQSVPVATGSGEAIGA